MTKKKTFNKKYKKLIEEYVRLMSEQKFDKIDAKIREIRKLQNE